MSAASSWSRQVADEGQVRSRRPAVLQDHLPSRESLEKLKRITRSLPAWARPSMSSGAAGGQEGHRQPQPPQAEVEQGPGRRRRSSVDPHRRAARMAWTAWSKASGERLSAVFSRQACCCSSQAAGRRPSWRRVPAIFTAGPVACSSTRALRALVRQPAWRAKRRWRRTGPAAEPASDGQEEEAVGVGVDEVENFLARPGQFLRGTESCSSMEPTSFQLRL